MARQKGANNFAGTLEVLAAAPLDARSIVPTKADLTASANFPYPYVGMEVYVTAENKKYRLTTNDPTTLSNWEEVGAGGGSYVSGDGIDVDGNVIRTDDTVYRTPDQTSADLADGDYIPFYDVSTSHKKKTLWGNIKTLLADIFQSKLTFGDGISIDQNNEISTERMESSDIDDLDLDGAGQPSGMVIDLDGNELVVGTVIQNGVRKPLYQKTIDCGALADSTQIAVAHGISNIDEIFLVTGRQKNSDYFMSLNYNDPKYNAAQTGIFADKTNVYLHTSTGTSGYSAIATIQYTKTT